MKSKKVLANSKDRGFVEGLNSDDGGTAFGMSALSPLNSTGGPDFLN